MATKKLGAKRSRRTVARRASKRRTQAGRKRRAPKETYLWPSRVVRPVPPTLFS